MIAMTQTLRVDRNLAGAGLGIILMALAGIGLDSVAAQEQPAEISEHQFLYEYIYFRVDSTDILPSSVDALQRKAMWLKQNPDVSVMIEGHCDARGSEISNLLLGEARAGKIKTHLVKQGIQASRMLTISYGEADPVDPGKNEEAYSKNRRARFVRQ